MSHLQSLDRTLANHTVLISNDCAGASDWLTSLVSRQLKQASSFILVGNAQDAPPSFMVTPTFKKYIELRNFSVFDPTLSSNEPNSQTFNPLEIGTIEQVSERLMGISLFTPNAGQSLRNRSNDANTLNLLKALVTLSREVWNFTTFKLLHGLLTDDVILRQALTSTVVRKEIAMALSETLQPYLNVTDNNYNCKAIQEALGPIFGHIEYFANKPSLNSKLPTIHLLNIIHNQAGVYFPLNLNSDNPADQAYAHLVTQTITDSLAHVALEESSKPMPLLITWGVVLPQTQSLAELMSKATRAKIRVVSGFKSFRQAGRLSILDTVTLEKPNVTKILFGEDTRDDSGLVKHFISTWAATATNPHEFENGYQHLSEADPHEGLLLSNGHTVRFETIPAY